MNPTLPLIDTFELLAEAAGTRYPIPERENRGLCPAHQDRYNPALVFRISDDEDALLVHCFARECGLKEIAEAIGVSPASFFAGGTNQKRDTAIQRPKWRYLPFLELIKLLPFIRHFDDEVEAVFDVMEVLGVERLQAPMRELPRTTIETCIWEYSKSEFTEGDDWYEIRDNSYALLRQWDLEQRSNIAEETNEQL